MELPIPNKKVLKRRDDIIKQLIDIVGRDGVISDEDGRRTFESDALSAYRCMPLAVTLPRNTIEVSKLLKYCQRESIKVVARGAGTSLCGGALPSEDSVVIGVSRMNRILDIDYEARIAHVESGITNLAITKAVEKEGFFYAPDPSSQIACTLAGNLAMNSGGAHCLKYGVTTNNVLGAKMVLMDGEVIDLGGPQLDADAYDLLGLVIGSEGQFGIITEVIVRILRAAEGARPMLLGFPSSEAAGKCVAAIIGAGIVPVAIEFMDKLAIQVCEDFAHAGYPLEAEALLIVEVEGSEEEISEGLERIKRLAGPFSPLSVETAQSAEQAEKIWRGRKSAFGAMGRISDYFCMDGVIPLSRLGEVLGRIKQICDGYGLKVANIFHAGDGNLHPLILYDANNAEEMQKAEAAGADILTLCVEVGGCLSGEHGIGVEKRDLMPQQLSEMELAQQMRIKTVFDPDWLLNPAKVFPLRGRDDAGKSA